MPDDSPGRGETTVEGNGENIKRIVSTFIQSEKRYGILSAYSMADV